MTSSRNNAPLSKRTRFEIFKRDGFVCQYCGSRPPDVVLEVDHIDPRANGGSNDHINLVTSCEPCNRGKSDKKLNSIRPRPDADVAYLQAQQEIVEAKRYLDIKKQRDALETPILDALIDTWLNCFDGQVPIPDKTVFKQWLLEHSPEEIEMAIIKCAGSEMRGKVYGSLYKIIPYMWGILRNQAKEREQSFSATSGR